jgi:hypothetical protein
MKMKIINLTPHEVKVVTEDGTVVAAYPSEGSAWFAQVNTPTGEIDGVPTCKVTYGEAQGLPAPEAGKAYVVSYITIATLRLNGSRTTDDLYYPTEQVRGAAGVIVGCRYLAQ